MTPFTFIVASLAIWRLSYAIVRENGPLMVFARLRARLGAHQKRSGGLFDLVSCVRCLSFWIGLIAALSVSDGFIEWLAYGFAFSAVATLIDLFLTKKPNALPVITSPTANNQVPVGRRTPSK